MVRKSGMKCICLGSAKDNIGPFSANLLPLGMSKMSNNNEMKLLEVEKKGLTNKKVILNPSYEDIKYLINFRPVSGK